MMVEVLKVSSRSSPNAVAGALAGVVRHDGAAELQVVGAGALNQAVKAVAIARGYLTPSGVDLVCIPTFADIEIGGEGRTALRLLCEDRRAAVDGVDGRHRRAEVPARLHVDLTAYEPGVQPTPT
jgi:stage V sporulation protein S